MVRPETLSREQGKRPVLHCRRVHLVPQGTTASRSPAPSPFVSPWILKATVQGYAVIVVVTPEYSGACNPDDQNIADPIADLGHFCGKEGHNFHAVLRRAFRNWQAER